jgi:beta-lactamase superfamily II metal-dependent hydrolase
MFDGFEVDMLNLGDADCVVVTEWTTYGPFRVLIDGGRESDAEIIREFFHRRDYRVFYAAVCTHLHDDHAGGLIKLLRDRTLVFVTGWMHDIRNHISADALRRAGAGDSGEAQAVKQVVETTDELARAFASRSLVPAEPFAGRLISHFPQLVVVGPDEGFYTRTLEEFADVDLPPPLPSPYFATAASALGGIPSLPPSFYQQLLSRPQPRVPLSSLLPGALSGSSVKKRPVTQPFNNTSSIIGCSFRGSKLLFTSDAGSDALDRLPPHWNSLAWMQVPHHGSDGNLSQRNIERFCPRWAMVSAKGDLSHPSRAIVNGLVKVGAKVASTHTNGHLWFWLGNVPMREDYGPVTFLQGAVSAGWGGR